MIIASLWFNTHSCFQKLIESSVNLHRNIVLPFPFCGRFLLTLCHRSKVTKYRICGLIRTTVVPDTKASTLKPIIQGLVAKGSIVVTDEWLGYTGLGRDYMHIVVNHRQGEYTRGAFSSNNVENFWSLLNRGIYGIYHQVSPKHLHRYCYEFEYRFNLRKQQDVAKFIQSVKQADGKRLTYKSLIAKPPVPDVIVDEDGVVVE